MRPVLRVAGRAIVISSLAVVSWLVLGARPLFYLAALITTYTAIMVPLVLGTSDRIGVVKRLRQAAVQMKSQDTLTISLEGISTRSPLSIRLQPLVPEYIIRESSSWHDRTCILQFHVNRRGVYALGEGILSVTDPLRLFRISRRLIADEKLTVFPHGPSPRETAYLTDLSPRWSARLGMRTGGFLPLSRPRLRANGPPIRASSQSSRQSSTRCPFRNRHSGSVKPLIRFFTMLDALSCHRRIITCLLRVPQSEVSGAQ